MLDLCDYWNEYPPLHLLMRAFVGYRPPVKDPRPALEATEAMAGIYGGKRKRFDCLPAAIQQDLVDRGLLKFSIN